ncbi:UDP-N-acetyl-D-mannosamine dehydrogenase [Corynebacterium minutissimum]|uniref:UDP-N-acetyl-D-mannosamine dehydrogenase n=1 Tax=Corynebacterium minutissimum TaxID=38301 RepID=A0A2X4RAH2_9CORY|nr:UDP-N-acetyl-D-mannosamine dehydrogenase [Corynebacterium minutissimum]KHO28765.1 UDP-N-acetyl-D-mannosaminuronic acid dehydrogenase [Corynebacterium minutissimum]QPS59391.1 UDP-N-acetyl-D-mannosamine dehydrogenase [Corynebacterium minutissimum]QQA79820.1 UDP-N-acetyl-D-mannosamine dehydrogenase [Corynebacterium minutissimum]SQH99196.1 UDP-N-acetyl-D-mannosaminuronic acid dehydrogenase [Corynebacterium minutissimum]VEG06528.1 UDP-N-acetyl-D-mannosaminuronic acid dehydrogenase [Corynebacteri
MTPQENAANSFDKVCVVGLGYIGLPTAAFIASKGVKVVGVDVNERFVKLINEGKVPFFEPGFEELLAKVVEEGNLVAQAEQVEADAYIVCVPTPFQDNHEVDTKYIRAASEALAPHLRPGALVVLESTSPPGTTEDMANHLIELRPDLSLDDEDDNAIFVAHCPERVLPGQIMEEMENNDRVIGGLTPKGTELARDLYATFCTAELLMTNATTAEMAKLTENSFRDVNIAFANELSLICDRLGIDVWELIELANHHPRVNILQPGPGVGGHCIAVDPWFIVSAAPEEAKLIKLARDVNDGKPEWVIEQVVKALEGNEKPVVTALGIAFKNDIDDLRESPSLEIVKRLGVDNPELDIRVVEPNVDELPAVLSNISNLTKQDTKEAIAAADVVLLLVNHKEFVNLDQSVLEGKTVIDTKGIWR